MGGGSKYLASLGSAAVVLVGWKVGGALIHDVYICDKHGGCDVLSK